MRRRWIALGLAVVGMCAPAPVAADTDVTAPVGSVSVVHDDRANALIRLDVTATDDLSGVATVEVSGDGVTWASFAYAPQVDWLVFDPASGGAPVLGNRTVRVRWTDGVGNTSVPDTTTLYLGRGGALEYPVPPVTGQPFTIRPIFGPSVTLAPDDTCSYELTWGTKASLVDFAPDETYGSLYLAGPKSKGFCGAWTFTIPWVPIPQFVIWFNSPVSSVGDDEWEFKSKFYPASSSTDRRIRSSNLPLVQVIPDGYEMVVGQPFTYRAYPLGVSLTAKDFWAVLTPSHGHYKTQYGGSRFTFTPNAPGAWLVVWSSGLRNDLTFNATYDPKARRPDYYRPNTTAPVQRIGSGTAGTSIPVTLSWSGSDQGWGIAKYQLQRSTDGGAWHGVTLATLKATSITQQLPVGHRYRYRVRAVDKYGNVGFWDYGPTFRPGSISDGSLSYGPSWTGSSDPLALGGGIHQSSTTGAWAKLTFTGRDIAWVAAKGPGNGRARVYIDGVLKATIDLLAGTDTPRQIVFRAHWKAVGQHTLRIVVEGTVGRPAIIVDGIAVLK